MKCIFYELQYIFPTSATKKSMIYHITTILLGYDRRILGLNILPKLESVKEQTYFQ